MAYLLDKDPLNFEDREELKLNELKVPKLPDKEGMSFTKRRAEAHGLQPVGKRAN